MTVTEFMPTYPRVRCDSCHRTYERPHSLPVEVETRCPHCGGVKFSTLLLGNTTITVRSSP